MAVSRRASARRWREQIVHDPDSGQLLTASFMDYQMPRAADLPDIRLATREAPTKVNPLGAKGVGEAGTVGALAAAMNAVNDALAPSASATSTCRRRR